MDMTLPIALLIDLMFGEPPAIIHPVVGFGKVIEFFDNKYRRRSPYLDFLVGAISSLVVIGLAFILSHLPNFLPNPFNLILSIYLLKSSFAIRSLHDHVKRTITPDLEEKRRAVSMIVSRDTKSLDEPHLNSAAIESLSENINDSVIAPLFYYLIFGLPGAVVYRAVNTLDAMIGYRNEKYEYFGKFAARLDDLLNFVPARITVLLFLSLGGRKVIRYYRMAKYKINSDKPIAAMSAVLGVWLEKPNYYKFPGRRPENEDIKRALKVYWIIVVEFLLIVAIILYGG
ncbi:cobalamin biosynthesis protein [Pyrococcus furiosus DSM 3638]|uniref:Probable cobalamin biosynthesis protein CobD n=3 Tax=Pyrococcus furiosus TaxID=2261 RepID=COBD_PYRFU|nr:MULTISPECIES: adenosylcobinamide-phosphate synthase CbiB [Pyrococcus]Q8U403.1 RecName: Full=Probable cobalamin biosynthesis protein CobD [Pyrococcus furiosus DSM 3638]AAL80420.1 cobalamin biosynthesis protein [Pyrococcus furiosus DSM 3638]AFN03083.1 cobalamin biosynthesis protein [Pyrococcus furiosus COM1]MDK2870129.1 adenosylcobinamide-phosphate synthase [Pyrococcus sp.]QEK78013.1 cobalamin biosynthesis protein [Pyrococcus furiosus DSM 3638]